jgi:Cellulose binding domain
MPRPPAPSAAPATASDIPVTKSQSAQVPDRTATLPAPPPDRPTTLSDQAPVKPQAQAHTTTPPPPPPAHPQAPDHTVALPTQAPPPPGASHHPPYLANPGGEPPGAPPFPPTPKPSSNGPSRRMTAALAAAGVAVLLAAGIALAFSQLGGSSKNPCTGASCATNAQRKTTKAPPAGPKLRYRTVDRETGYFEGTIAIVNPGTRPMRAWTLTFTYPGADIHNVWEAVLQRKGQTVTIVNAMTAAPIAPGRSFEVQFGGAGRPAMPTGCRLNDAPCVFVR